MVTTYIVGPIADPGAFFSAATDQGADINTNLGTWTANGEEWLNGGTQLFHDGTLDIVCTWTGSLTQGASGSVGTSTGTDLTAVITDALSNMPVDINVGSVTQTGIYEDVFLTPEQSYNIDVENSFTVVSWSEGGGGADAGIPAVDSLSTTGTTCIAVIGIVPIVENRQRVQFTQAGFKSGMDELQIGVVSPYGSFADIVYSTNGVAPGDGFGPNGAITILGGVDVRTIQIIGTAPFNALDDNVVTNPGLTVQDQLTLLAVPPPGQFLFYVPGATYMAIYQTDVFNPAATVPFPKAMPDISVNFPSGGNATSPTVVSLPRMPCCYRGGYPF